MWFNRKKPPPIRSLVGEGMVVRGDISFTEGLRVDGQVFGNVVASVEGRSILVISDNARVQGMVSASHVIINGEVLGPVASTEMLELQPKARVLGDVRYELLEMHTGAVVEGELKPLKTADKPALKLAASNDA
jgi:cytoskeletal protein CcmA (bactofilin family)